MKFSQLIEYNLRNIFLKKTYTNVVEKLFSDPFLKNQNWGSFWINDLYILYIFCFYCWSSWGISELIGTKLQTSCIYLIWNFKKKKKRGVELVSLPHFIHDFWRKIFLLLRSFTKFQCLVPFTSWDIGKYGYYNSLLTKPWRNKFWIYSLIFLIKPFFCMTKKSRQKFKYLEN